jgi:hypothetical protein
MHLSVGHHTIFCPGPKLNPHLAFQGMKKLPFGLTLPRRLLTSGVAVFGYPRSGRRALGFSQRGANTTGKNLDNLRLML